MAGCGEELAAVGAAETRMTAHADLPQKEKHRARALQAIAHECCVTDLTDGFCVPRDGKCQMMGKHIRGTCVGQAEAILQSIEASGCYVAFRSGVAGVKGHIPGPRPRGKPRPTKCEIIAWAGFVDGRLDEWLSGFYDVEHLAIFRTRREARRCHQDVRRVRIILDKLP